MVQDDGTQFEPVNEADLPETMFAKAPYTEDLKYNQLPLSGKIEDRRNEDATLWDSFFKNVSGALSFYFKGGAKDLYGSIFPNHISPDEMAKLLSSDEGAKFHPLIQKLGAHHIDNLEEASKLQNRKLDEADALKQQWKDWNAKIEKRRQSEQDLEDMDTGDGEADLPVKSRPHLPLPEDDPTSNQRGPR